MHNYRDTSAEAFQNARIGDTQARVLQFVQSAGDHGATCDEAIEKLGIPHQSASPAFTALERSGNIARTSQRRATRTGSSAAIYRWSIPGSLFSSPRVSPTELRKAAIKAAIEARATGNWQRFDEALAELESAERSQ